MSDIEADDAVKMTIKSLVEVAHHAIDIIVWKLSEEIEKLARVRMILLSFTLSKNAS